MKTTNKLTVLAVCLIAAAALVTTSCSGFGKDDFFGTWDSGNYEFGGKYYKVNFYFSGASENLINGKNAMFYEEYTRYTDNTYSKVAAHNFWWGVYGLSDNSGVTSGNLTLKYYYGYDLTQTGAKTVSALVSTLTNSSDPATDFEKIAKYDYYDATEKACSDVEKFSYTLTKSSSAGIFDGYDTFAATAVSQWTEWTDTTVTYEGDACYDAKYTKSSPKDGTSWGDAGTERDFTLSSENTDATVSSTVIDKLTSSSNVYKSTEFKSFGEASDTAAEK